MTGGFPAAGERLPRWTILPGDPPALKNWLIDKARSEAPVQMADLPEPPLDDENDWRAA